MWRTLTCNWLPRIHVPFIGWGCNLPNMLYCDISSLQPMEIYVDDEAKLTFHGLVQVWPFHLSVCSCCFEVCLCLTCPYDSTTSNWVSWRKTGSWTICWMHWISIKLLFLSKVSIELLSWTSCLWSVIFLPFAIWFH